MIGPFIKDIFSKLYFRYIFFVSLFLWIVISIFIWYTYVRSSSERISSKWGTFVEWIFDNTSYLPYLRTDEQSYFYQGLLFNSCLKHTVTNSGSFYKQDICEIDTTDNQTYFLSFSGNAIWSDWTPLSMDDIAFTYDDIIIKNKWSIKWLSIYNDIKISRESPNQLKIIFPRASIDNKLFFTNYILPKHILQDFDIQWYRDIFSVQPTYTNCANIVPETNDQYSLIFNLLNCKDTHLNFYQIKNLISFENFSNGDQNPKNSIIDVYVWEKPVSGYVDKKLMTNKIVTVFFNTNSDRLRVRTRRALGWLIKRNFYTTWYDDYVIKNADWLFDVFMSTWANIKEYLSTSDVDSISKKDLVDSKVQELPASISITWNDQKVVFFVEQEANAKALNVRFSNTYDTVSLEHKWKIVYDKYYSSKNKKASFSLVQAGNFERGINKYVLQGSQKGKKFTIATIDIYNIIPTNTTGLDINPITFLYFNSPNYLPIIENIKNIFQTSWISEYFSFKWIDDPDEFQSTLLLWDYDLTLNTIDMWERKDITKLFATDSAKTNPSQYQNQNLISLLQQYTDQKDIRILDQINEIYAKDMPFVILGKAFVPIHIKENLVDKIYTDTGIQLYDFNWRTTLYNNLELVNNIHVDGKRVWNTENFTTFIKKSLGIENKNTSTNTGSIITPNL